MAFQIKDFASITAAMINYVKATTTKVTDFRVGSVIRTLMEAFAVEMDQLYQEMFHGIKEAIPVSVFNSFGFTARAAVAASGTLKFTLSFPVAQPTVIQAGFRVTTANGDLKYVTSTTLTIPAGSTVGTVSGYCETAGAAGNTGAGTITVLVDSITSSAALLVTNTTIFQNGADAETDVQREIRFQSYVSSLARGTIRALEYAASQATVTNSAGDIIEAVNSVKVVEPYLTDSSQPVALVEVYIHNGTGGTSSSLITRARNIIYGYYDDDGNAVPGYKSAGVIVNVYTAADIIQNVTASISAATGYVASSLTSDVQSVIAGYIQGLDVGSPCLISELYKAAMDVDGVADVTFSAPVANVSVTKTQKLLPGTITITAS